MIRVKTPWAGERRIVGGTVRASGTGMGKRRAGWEHFEHMADVGVRGLGSTRAEALESAARTLIAAVADVDAVRPRKSAWG